MMRKTSFVTRLALGAAAALFACGVASAGESRGNADQKGSVLIFPKILVDTAKGVDTFIDITNAGDNHIYVTCYWIDGDTWEHPDFHFSLTPRQPAYFRASDGTPGPMGKGVAGFPSNPGEGELKCWASDAYDAAVKYNYLKGEAIINDTGNDSAWEYGAWSFACRATGKVLERCGTAGEIRLDGKVFDQCPNTLELDFFSSNDKTGQTTPLGGTVDTDLAIIACDQDLTQEGLPVTTKQTYVIWNENEGKTTGLTRCFTCFDEEKLSVIGGAFKRSVLKTEKGLARIDSSADSTKCCPKELDANGNMVSTKCATAPALIGVRVTEIARKGPRTDRAGGPLVGAGLQSGLITFDLGNGSEEGR
jgi:hypothetical protein